MISSSSGAGRTEGGDVRNTMGRQKKLSQEQILRELVAIGFAKATDYLSVDNGKLLVKPTEEWKSAAAIASVENTSNGLRVKFYDKMKALELLGKYFGLFEGKAAPKAAQENNLLERILADTQKEVDLRDIPELQQTADTGDDLVEPPEAEGV